MGKPSRWEEREDEGSRWWAIEGASCTVHLVPRAAHCDRGCWLAQLEAVGDFARSIDDQDGWPRYYFDEGRAKLEVEAWLKRRGQWVAPEPAVHVLVYGRTLGDPHGTMLGYQPGNWPEGHRWVSSAAIERARVTCALCLEVIAGGACAREMPAR